MQHSGRFGRGSTVSILFSVNSSKLIRPGRRGVSSFYALLEDLTIIDIMISFCKKKTLKKLLHEKCKCSINVIP